MLIGIKPRIFIGFYNLKDNFFGKGEYFWANGQKYVGNFHSSWFGLWRPLTEQSRVGLLITSILFGVVSLMSIGFFMYLNRQSFSAPASLTTASSSGIRNLYTGGFRK